MRHLSALLLPLCLAACAQPAPPPPPAAPPRHLAMRKLPHPLPAAWLFHGQESCIATAQRGTLSFSVDALGPRLVITAHTFGAAALPERRAMPIAFSGPAGEWRLIGHVTEPDVVSVTQTMDNQAADRVLALLQGGIVSIGGPEDSLPRLNLPESGAPGRNWFECVKRQLQN